MQVKQVIPMESITFGLPWTHPAVVLNGAAILLDLAYELIAYFVGSMQPGTSVYYRAPFAGLAMAWAGLYGIADSDSRIQHWVCYALGVLNLILGLGMLFVGIAYAMGPESMLWRLLVDA